MNENRQQLFAVVKSVKLPKYAVKNRADNAWSVRHSAYPALISFYWPSGEPCVPAEMFLLHRAGTLKSEATRGGSLRVEASNLSHFVRFCFARSIRIQDLTREDFSEFTDQLTEDQGTRLDGWAARGPNTVRAIIATVINFLRWYQEEFATGIKLVGTAAEGAIVRLIEKQTTHFSGKKTTTFEYIDTPPHGPQTAKMPMPNAHIARIWQAVHETSAHATRQITSDKSTASLRDLRTNYLYRRRIAVLMLAEETGLRPEELSLMTRADNLNVLDERMLRIPTVKRREPTPMVRSLPCSLELCFALAEMGDCRDALLAALPSTRRAAAIEHDRLFVTTNGSALSAASLEREFARLVRKAGISKPEKACLSMYRHRFLTRRCAYYIREFKLPRIAGGADVTVTDNATILGRLIELTGQKSLRSAKHYISLGFKELGVFDDVDATIELDRDLRALAHAIRRVREDHTFIDESEKLKAINECETQLSELSQRLQTFLTRSPKS
jgi:integrase